MNILDLEVKVISAKLLLETIQMQFMDSTAHIKIQGVPETTLIDWAEKEEKHIIPPVAADPYHHIVLSEKYGTITIESLKKEVIHE